MYMLLCCRFRIAGIINSNGGAFIVIKCFTVYIGVTLEKFKSAINIYPLKIEIIPFSKNDVSNKNKAGKANCYTNCEEPNRKITTEIWNKDG